MNLLKLDISMYNTYYLETQRAQDKKCNHCPTELSSLCIVTNLVSASSSISDSATSSFSLKLTSAHSISKEHMLQVFGYTEGVV